MGKITTENRRALESAASYEDAALTGMTDYAFSLAFSQLIEQKGVPVLTITERTNISKSYINKLRSPAEKDVHPSRRVIIDIALAINATLDETNQLLKAACYQELYTRDKAESFIIWAMLKNIPGPEIRKMLTEKGLDEMFQEK